MSLSEAFKQLDCLNEDVFEVSDKGIEELKDFRDSDDSDDTIEVIDPEAENKEEIKDSYVGKIICQCNVCKSLVYFDKDDIQIDEENSTVNADKECPFCFTNSGYSIVGEVAPYSDYQVEATDEDGNKVDVEVTVDGRDIPQDKETLNTEDEDSETDESVEKDEKLSLKKIKNESIRGNRMRKNCSESLDSIKLDDGNQEIEIKTKEKEDLPKDSMMVPPSDDTLEDILSDKESEIEEQDNDDEEEDDESMPEDGDIVDVDVDEVEDESFNRLGESFLKKVYGNVKSFRTTSAATNGNTLVLEGLITFKSGKSKPTTFKFEANKINSKGKIRFLGENKDISSGRKSFALNCKVSRKAIIPESMTYNYVARGLNESQRVTGTVRLNESTRIRRR